jgi:uracil-DNA glycosylase family 4
MQTVSRSASLQQLRCQASSCTGCGLFATRINVVFGEGPYNASIMVIGEGPGEQEDQYGVPFIGRAGQLLTTIMDQAKIQRNEVYITNVVKCRPPGNRDPETAEKLACSRFLNQQLEIVNPKIVVLVGRIAASAYLGRDVKITKERGVWLPRRNENQPHVMIVLHPSYLLRNKDDNAMIDTIKDFMEIRRLDNEINYSKSQSRFSLDDE